MKAYRLVAMTIVASGLIAWASAARAEDWLDTGHVTLIDGDSIHKQGDGLVHFMEKDKYHHDDEGPNTPREGAVDCVNRISYSAYGMDDPNWRSKGDRVIKGTMGEQLLDFVCARVK